MIEESRNLEIRTNRGSDRERRALESTLAHHNIGTNIILDPREEEAEVDTVEVTEELHCLALSGDLDPDQAVSEVDFHQIKEYTCIILYFSKVAGVVAAEVVVDFNSNMVTPTDHEYASIVPLTQDIRSKQSLIKVNISLKFGFIVISYH